MMKGTKIEHPLSREFWPMEMHCLKLSGIQLRFIQSP